VTSKLPQLTVLWAGKYFVNLVSISNCHAMVKYLSSPEESELLPNLLNLSNRDDIDKSEFEGFLLAELSLTEELTVRTKFNVKYIKRIHKLSLGHLYSFAGKYRTVNMSKGGFLFPAAQFISQNMNDFEKEILLNLPAKYDSNNSLIRDIAKVHGEFLFIHPFREGNGRVARVLANLMARKQGVKGLNFEKINEKVFPEYVSAVQMVADRNYEPMERIIELIF
jgi:cell filamentation protein